MFPPTRSEYPIPLSPTYLSGLGTAYDGGISSDGKHLYISNDNPTTGTVVCFSRSNNLLTLVGSYTTPGPSPWTAVEFTDSGSGNSYVYVPQPGNSYIAMCSRNKSTGVLTALSTTQVICSGQPRDIKISPDGLFAYAGDAVGGSGWNVFNRSTSTGILTANSHPSSSGDWYKWLISPDGLFVYATNAASSTVSQFSRNTSTGALTALSPGSVSTSSGTARGIVMSPDGLFVYVSNQTANTISIFSRNTSTGKLTSVTNMSSGYTNYDGITISPSGNSVYLGTSSGIAHYQRNWSTGLLRRVYSITGGSGSNMPIIAPDGLGIYGGFDDGNNLYQYRLG